MIISVAGGKGGSGKTLVATSLALSLKGIGKVQLLDCDAETPNDYIFVKPAITGTEVVSILVPEVDKEKCTYCGKCAEVCAYDALQITENKVLIFPELCYGCGACSYLCPEEAISEMEREIGVVELGHCDGVDFVQGKLSLGEAIALPVIRKVKEYSGREGTVIIDVSSGRSCLLVEAIKGSDFCLLVTEPTPFGLNDLVLVVEVVRKLNIPCGVVLNRTGVGDGKVEEYCRSERIPILLTIPLDTQIAGFYSRGMPLVEGIPQWRQSFHKLFYQVREAVVGRRS